MRAASVVLLSALLFSSAWGEESVDPHAAHRAAAALAPTEPAGLSIHRLESHWQTHLGGEIKLADLAGRIQVLAMVYTHCQAACPRILADMRRIRSRAGTPDARLGFVLVSIDPDRDTPARLASFARDSDLAESGWLLLRGSDADVRELAAVLGVSYRREGERDFAHSNVISVIDPRGVVVHQQVGLGIEPDATLEAIAKLRAANEGDRSQSD